MLSIENISVRFPSFTLDPISLTVEKQDYLTLLGVSGAGKTVLLEVLAGLVKPDQGRIMLNGEDITGQKIQQRRIGLVYQDLSLFPHMNVFNNIAFPIRRKGQSKSAIQEKVKTLALQTEVSHLLDRSPDTLSGGEAQRVALARTLAADPDILLLDEPLSNLDVKLKTGLRKLLRSIHKSGKTIIHVTHDYMEAATLANKVAVVQNGKLIQHGTPEEVFRHPRSEFVARFSGVKNIFPCRSATHKVHDGLQSAIVGDGLTIQYLGNQACKEGFLIIPQYDIIVSEKLLESSAVNKVKGSIREIHIAGSGLEVIVDAGVEFVVSISKHSKEAMALEPGKEVWLSFKASAVRFIED